MSPLLITSTILITCALLFYSIGVWSERISKYLKTWIIWLVPYIGGMFLGMAQ